MLCISIAPSNYIEGCQQLKKAAALSSLVELRVDKFATIDCEAIDALMQSTSTPILLTLRSQRHGGGFTGTLQEQAALLRQLVMLRPAYLDIEEQLPTSLSDEIQERYGVHVIVSHHDIHTTTEDLSSLWHRLRRHRATYYKLATYAETTSDACRLLLSAKPYAPHAIAVAMGSMGQISRILAPILAHPLTYAALSEEMATAPGQLDIHTLVERYRHNILKAGSRWYALIGDPVASSIGHITHNSFYSSLQLDAVYLKLQVHENELTTILPMLQQLGCRGCSVTMPHKEAVIPLLDDIDIAARAIGAVNTIVYDSGRVIGYNTDGDSALDALAAKTPIPGMQMVIIGAGGAARAIACTAKKRGAIVTIVNRNEKRAHQLAAEYGCAGGSLADIATISERGYDILVNTTPAPMPIDPSHLLPGSYVMDITTNPPMTPLLQEAMRRGCNLIMGYEMYIRQAIGQLRIWFPEVEVEDTDERGK